MRCAAALREIGGLAPARARRRIAVAALATWSVQDPSSATPPTRRCATCSAARGAISADLMMQLFGIASHRAGAAGRGLGLAAADPPPARPRTAARCCSGLSASLLAAGFASCLPHSAAWPLPTGLGGVIGDAMLRVPAGLFGGPLAGIDALAIALACSALLRCRAIAFASGFGWRRPSRTR